MHPGRVVLALGREDFSTHARPETVARGRDAERGARRVHAGGRGRGSDQRDPVRLTWAQEHAPLMMAGTGPRSLRLAGAMADTVTVELGASPDAVSRAVKNIRRGAQEASRDPDGVKIIVLCAM